MMPVAVRKSKKADGINKSLELHKSFLQKNLKSYFPIGSYCQYAWYKPIFYWLHGMAACCYFGADLGNGLDQNFPSRLTDGTRHSSSDLLYSSSPLYLDKLSKVQLPFPSYSHGQNYSSFFSLDKKFLSQGSLFSLLYLDRSLNSVR